jgi:hypothetical protein
VCGQGWTGWDRIACDDQELLLVHVKGEATEASNDGRIKRERLRRIQGHHWLEAGEERKKWGSVAEHERSRCWCWDTRDEKEKNI